MREKKSPMGQSGLPPLNALRAFEAAARHGSFVAAATDLHVTHWAVGKQIKLLENWFGVPLFERRPRGVALTRRWHGTARRGERGVFPPRRRGGKAAAL
jgi:LysR family glycine cleavage system transcriptional activator